jgi:hypothetical protein
MNIATNLNPIGSVSALQSFIKIAREIHGTVKSLGVNFASWEKTFEDQHYPATRQRLQTHSDGPGQLDLFGRTQMMMAMIRSGT